MDKYLDSATEERQSAYEALGRTVDRLVALMDVVRLRLSDRDQLTSRTRLLRVQTATLFLSGPAPDPNDYREADKEQAVKAGKEAEKAQARFGEFIAPIARNLRPPGRYAIWFGSECTVGRNHCAARSIDCVRG